VGKTFLLSNTWQPHEYFLFTAAHTTPALHRRQLVEDFAHWSDQRLFPEDYPTWSAVFDLLLSRQSTEHLVIMLDQFQYLAGATGG
jgi:hypothetical protein